MSSISMAALVCGVIIAVFSTVLIVDLVRFARAQNKTKKNSGRKVDAGGVLFIQGGKTYYQMPNGQRRLIAGYPMDLTPGSRDMNIFTATLDRARQEYEKDAENKRREALAKMHVVSRESVKADAVERR